MSFIISTSNPKALIAHVYSVQKEPVAAPYQGRGFSLKIARYTASTGISYEAGELIPLNSTSMLVFLDPRWLYANDIQVNEQKKKTPN